MPYEAIHFCGIGLIILLAARPAEARVEAEALVGRPFGVGQVTISGLDVAIDANRVVIEEKNGRVFYPAVSQGVFGRLIGRFSAPTDRPAGGVTIYFLFRGDQPLELTVYTPQTVPLVGAAASRQSAPFRARADAVVAAIQRLSGGSERADDNQPPLVPTYLTTMLAQRLGLEPPLVERLQDARSQHARRRSRWSCCSAWSGCGWRRSKTRCSAAAILAKPPNLPLPPDAGLVAACRCRPTCRGGRDRADRACTCRTNGSMSASASSRTTSG